MDFVFFIFEIIGVIAFSLSGALTAMKKNMDVFGACVLGMTTAIGGGIIRDLILGINPPNAFSNPIYAIVGFAVPILTYIPLIQKFLTHKHKTYDICLFLADSIGLGIFTVIGVDTCLDILSNPNLFTTIFLGVITGVGGGIFRDVLSLNLPEIFIKYFYACASIIGAAVCYVARIVFDILTASLLGISIIIILRLLAFFLHWKLPKPKYPFEKQ